MKKFIGFFLALTLVISISLVSPQATYAATDYCNSGNANGVSYGFGNVRVENGHIKSGACHIQYYHLAHPGNGTAIVDGERKSQFQDNLSRSSMASVAGQAIAGGTIEYAGDGKYKAESYVISANAKVRVIFHYKVIDKDTYKNVITMFPVY